MSSIFHPVIGYVGALISSKLDIGFLIYIAEQRPDWMIVLTGSEDDDFKNSRLHQFKNVLFTDQRPAENLPDFINVFYVCINPQLVNNLTIVNYPRKVDEYLAMGKPVVATNTKAMDLFKEHVYTSNNKEDYVLLIEKALSENSQILATKRSRFAAQHTWQNSVAEIYKAINEKQVN